MTKLRRIAVVTGLCLSMLGVWSAGPAVAKTPGPLITGLAASPSTVNSSGGQSTISASVSYATSCMISATPGLPSGTRPVSCSGGTVDQVLTLPENTSTKEAVRYIIVLTATGPGGTKTERISVEVLAAVVESLTSVGYGSCALLTSDSVYCWGAGRWGDLGNGVFYTRSPYGHAVPVQVEGVGGTGTLSGVASLTGDKSGSTCAILDSGGVDCWGWGAQGQLGDGVFHTSSGGSAIPVQVEGVGGTGTLTGVESLTSDGYAYDFCALLDSGGVDCWGAGQYGQLGNGTFSNSATPVQVEGVGGTGTLTGVESLVSDTIGTYCALLDSGQVDCWGWGAEGELGNGTFYTASPYSSATLVQVLGLGGTGTLTGVTSLASDGGGFCALLDSGGVDCWGWGAEDALGNGASSKPRSTD